MSFFGKIKNAIFGGSAEAAPVTAGEPVKTLEPEAPVTASAAAPAAAAPATETAAETAPETALAAETPVVETVAPAEAAAPVEAAATAGEPVDIEPILDEAVKKNGQKLDWRRSIVDLLKALDLDSSLAARKELAEELGYTGEKDGSAEFNIWLHKAVIRKLVENGGKVPADLLD